jgi:hypothetical protein
MANSVTKVTRQSWGGRLGGSVTGAFVGVLIAIAAVALLFWNEGRAVERAKTLAEGAGKVVTVPGDVARPDNDGRLIHTSGTATTDAVLTDPLFGVSVNAIALERGVEMYQWVEKSESREEKKLGGSTETVTTYTYEKRWEGSPVDSSRFEHSAGHENPGMAFGSESWRAEDVRLGGFELAPALASQVRRSKPLPLGEEHLAAVPDGSLKQWLRLSGDGFYLGADAAAPAIGDVRVRFSVVEPAAVSVVGAQVGERIGPYRAEAGGEIALLTYGSATAETMFAAARTANTALTWALRFVGFILLFAGIRSVLRPFEIAADVVPFLGNLVGRGLGIASLLFAGPIALLTIAVGWVFYRPLLGVTLMAAAVGATVWLVRRARGPKAAPAAPLMVPPPPPGALAG